MAHPTEHPHIVVHPPAMDGSRRVTTGDRTLGLATHADDVSEILRLADLYVTDLEDADFIEWQGGGPDEWPGLSEHHEHHGQPHARQHEHHQH
ncbi:hypothetical protein HCJ93_08545 [Streptomyces sp. SBST2-5]|uniref:Uncharacterized protein n=1 Tax=Streptomyces composti TaxID=2720025 RepID=A0ABX1A146_9ACTN|nr:hypothetical protein [Streptomyces composti]NJP50119.1 hypothetical protein [Streptomyces composti]